jgi:hypothetical protein
MVFSPDPTAARLRRARRGPAVLCAVLARACAVTVHRTPIDMHGMGAGIQMCLAIAAATVAVSAVSVLRAALPRAPLSLVARAPMPARGRVERPPRARAGPPAFLALLVVRR